MVDPGDITVLIADEHALGKTMGGLIRRTAGSVLLVVPPSGLKGFSGNTELAAWCRELRSLNRDRSLMLVTKHRALQQAAKAEGWQVVRGLKQLKLLLKNHPSEAAALRVYSPVFWREKIRTRLQFVGLLTLPRLRIWILFGVSVLLFLFIIIRLLPSAEVKIWPNIESENFTTNVFLVSSGAQIPVPPERVRTLRLYPLTVSLDRTITFDQISKNFTGENASITLTVFNDSDEEYSLRKGTRLANQAGMRVRMKEDLILSPHSKETLNLAMDALDQYGEVVGERGNVPAGVRWDFPGLTDAERKLVYARNEKKATGGKTSYTTVLSKDDITAARARLEQELLTAAKQMVSEEIESRNHAENASLIQLNYDELTKVTYKDFDLSENFVGQQVTSIPVRGSIEYTVLLYDDSRLLELLKGEVLSRNSPDRVVNLTSLTKDHLNTHVIAPWDDDLNWVKITADLSYTQRYLLSPITPSGAKFGKYIRDNVAGKTTKDAYRIIKNLPEVSKVEISLWPPWALTLPSIGSNIAVTEESDYE